MEDGSLVFGKALDEKCLSDPAAPPDETDASLACSVPPLVKARELVLTVNKCRQANLLST